MVDGLQKRLENLQDPLTCNFLIDSCLFLTKHYNPVVLLMSLHFRNSLSSSLEHNPCIWLHAPLGNESAAKLQAAVPLNISSTVGGQPDPWTILVTVQCDRVFISKMAGHLVHTIPVAHRPMTEYGAQLLTPGQAFYEAGVPCLDFWKAARQRLPSVSFATQGNAPPATKFEPPERLDFQSFAASSPCSLLISFFMCIRIHFVVTLKPVTLFVRMSVYSCFSKRGYLPGLGFKMQLICFLAAPPFFRASSNCLSFAPHFETRLCDTLKTSATVCCVLSSSFNLLSSSMRRNLLTTRSLNFSLYTVLTGISLFPWRPLPLPLVAGIDEEEEEAGIDEAEEQAGIDEEEEEAGMDEEEEEAS